MKDKSKGEDPISKSNEITTIAMGVATLIGGGMGIYFLSAFFALPGSKYLLMAPYLSTIFYVMQYKLTSKYTLLKIGDRLCTHYDSHQYFYGYCDPAHNTADILDRFTVKNHWI